MRAASAIVLLLCFYLSGGINAQPLKDLDMILAGLYVNGQEVDDVDAYRQDNEYWLSLPDLERATGLLAAEQSNLLQLKTPIGEASLELSELGKLNGEFYLSASQLVQKLNIRLVFNQPLYAFTLDVPWRPGSPLYDEERQVAAPAEIAPDISAPNTSLGFLRLRFDYSRMTDSGLDSWASTLDMGGAVGEGTWLLGLRHQDNDKVRMDRYFWNRVFQHNAMRLGTNYVDLGLLLRNFDYTGAQWAYSNSDINNFTDFETDLNFDSFLREDVKVQRDIIRDDGPPGGIAELRLNDRPLGRVRVSLTGHYEFRNIPFRQGTFQTTEVYLYQRSLSDDPQVVNLTRSMVRQMLSGGEWLLRGGLGENGNSFYDDYGIPREGDAAGFFLLRYGLSDGLTVQGVVQQSKEGEQEIMAGLRTSLGQNWALAFDVADRERHLAFSSEILGWGEAWDFQFRSQYYEQNYRSNLDNSEFDHYLRSFYTVHDSLRIGMVGRILRGYQGQETEFIKPGVYWHPLNALSLSAVPNLDGNYRLRADWYITPFSRASATYENELFNLAYNHNFGSWLYSETGFDYDDDINDQRVYSRISWYLDENQYNYLQGGASYNGESVGWFISWNRIFTPGVELLLQYQNGYRAFSGLTTEPRLQISLRIDLASSGRRLVPTDNRRINFSRGGVSGSIRDEDGERINAENVDIRINGRRLPQYQAGGAFTVGNLRPGVYEVEIDEGNLPIEYVPEKRRYLVEVARATITEVGFVVKEEYGVAGRLVRRNGSPVANAVLVVLDDEGEELARSKSGRFGYYRMNALSPGAYKIRVIKVAGEFMPEPFTEIMVEVKHAFLFKQDLQIK